MAHNRKDKKPVSWAAAFDEIQAKNTIEPIGPGWATVHEIKKNLGFGTNRVHKFVSNGLAAGKMESFEGLAVGMHGKLVRRIWYRLK